MRGVPLGSLLAGLLRRPSLWGAAVGAVFATASRGWWRRRPFLPVPDPAYLDWRLATAYGSADEPPDVDDVIHYLEWRKRQQR